MTEWEFEDMLPRAISYAAAADFDDIPDTPEPDWSKTYRRKRAKFLRDPFAFVRRRAVPHWKHLLRVAACLLLVATLSLAALCLVNSEVRAKIYRWFTRLYESHTEYEFSGGQFETSLPTYTLTHVPEGYELTDHIVWLSGQLMSYENADKELLVFQYSYMQSGSVIGLNMDGVVISDVRVGNCPGQFYLTQDAEISNALVWQDEDAGIVYNLDGFFTEEEMLYLAERVALAE